MTELENDLENAGLSAADENTETAAMDSLSEDSPKEAKDEKKGKKHLIVRLLKIAFAVLAYFLIFKKILGREGSESLGERIAGLEFTWVALAVGMQIAAIVFAIARWNLLLRGQGIKAKPSFLAGSFMIGRFFGAFTPGGFTGLGGWRIYDVATRTGKAARATAVVGTEMLLGQVAFGLVVMGASIYGAKFLGTEGVILVNLFFGGVVVVALLLLARPTIVRAIASRLPGAIKRKVDTIVTAVTAYEGQGASLAIAVLLGVAVHAFNNLIYVCAAKALGVELSVGHVFFASSLQIFMTLLPITPNGLGLREATAVALYTNPTVGAGLPLAVAVLIPIVGFACEMFVSAFGGLIYVLRPASYKPEFEIEDDEREMRVYDEQEEVPLSEQPSIWRGLLLGAFGGFVAGAVIGSLEALVIIYSGGGAASLQAVPYGAAVYGVFCMCIGAGMGFGLAFLGRERDLGFSIGKLRAAWRGRKALPEATAFASYAAGIIALFAFALGAFRIRRDVFAEELVWKSAAGLGVLFACALAAGLLFIITRAKLRFLAERVPFFKSAAGSLGLGVLYAACITGIGAFGISSTEVSADVIAARAPAPDESGNVLFIVVDTLRADHLPGYGYTRGSTPNLDSFAQDAIRFDQAFANASWTRPSFASIMSGRLPANHGVMAKPDALPEEIVTIGEAFRDGGYETSGIATNFNVGPYFGFGQGFDRYVFLEPEFVLGADDSSAKLLLVQFLRQRIEKMRAASGQVDPASTYQDAEVVNTELLSWLDNRGDESRPFMAFVGYMDPHDPYYVHPYNGVGYSRAANQHPEPEEADYLRELYDGEITYWDEHFGQLIDELKARGLYDDLTIVVTSDHGEEFCEHGGFWHGTTLYDEQIRIPLYVKMAENARGGTTVRHWVQSIDLMPSVLRMSNLEVPESVQGGDIFEGTDVVYAEESHEGNVLESIRQRVGTDERKVIWANEGNPRGLEPVEMYRVDYDPGEQENVAPDSEDEVEEIGEVLEAMRAFAEQGAAAAEAREMSASEIERLCGLGYMERESCCESGFEAFCD